MPGINRRRLPSGCPSRAADSGRRGFPALESPRRNRFSSNGHLPRLGPAASATSMSTADEKTAAAAQPVSGPRRGPQSGGLPFWRGLGLRIPVGRPGPSAPLLPPGNVPRVGMRTLCPRTCPDLFSKAPLERLRSPRRAPAPPHPLRGPWATHELVREARGPGRSACVLGDPPCLGPLVRAPGPGSARPSACACVLAPGRSRGGGQLRA